MKRRIMIVEDDPNLRSVLRDNLVYEGYDVRVVGEGERALKDATSFHPDLVLLDIMLPGMDGFDVCRSLSQSHESAIIILTARDQSADKLRGLDLGADDYITKPFILGELLARIHAVLRRLHPREKALVLGKLKLDFGRYTATRNNEKVTFSQREIEVLEYMSERAGKVVTRKELLTQVWRYRHIPLTRSVDNLIARIRLKIEPDPENPRYIHTVYGDGYRLTPDP